MLAPVAKRLRADGLDVEFLALTTAQPYLAQQCISWIGYSDFPEAGDPGIRRLGEDLAAHLPDGPVSKDESVAYLGINYQELVTTHGAEAAQELYRTQGRQAFLPTRTMGRLVDRTNPRLVITTNSPRSELALLRAAHHKGIPSIALLDMFGLHEVKWLGTPTSATRVGVINEHVRRFFIDAGCSPEQVMVTGNPAFDSVNAPDTIAAGRDWRERHGISADQKLILWASQPEPQTHPFTGEHGDPALPRRIEKELRRIVASQAGWHLLVRYHPSETVDFVPGERVIFSPTSEALHPLLHAADTVVVMTSTVGLEAHLAGASVIAIEMSVIAPDAPFSRFGMARAVADLSELQGALQIETALRRPGGGRSDASCDKVVALVKDLLGSQGTGSRVSASPSA